MRREMSMLATASWIALGALAVSGLSALYARRAVNEAKQANKISLHVHKIEIYEEVVAFSDCFRGFFSVPTVERLEAFKKKAVQRAEIYLSEEVHEELQAIYAHCADNEIWLSIAESEGEAEGKPNSLKVRKEYKAVLERIYPVIQKIKEEAKISDA